MNSADMISRARILQLARTSGKPWKHLASALDSFHRSSQDADWQSLPESLRWDELSDTILWDEPGLFGDPVNIDVSTTAEELEKYAELGVRMILRTEAAFPTQLVAVKPALPFIFVSGKLKVDDRSSVAVIGSREASQEGLRAASQLAQEVTALGLTVTSGLAAGIDTAALTSALESQGRAVAVIGTGINRFFPRENKDLQERIAAEGLVISQFLPESSPTKTSFPMRNAVMSAYSTASLVVEAGERSGARLQAGIAFKQGRQVLLYKPIMERELWARQMVEKGQAHFCTTVTEGLRLP